MTISYQQTAAPTSLWPEPMEMVWQLVGVGEPVAGSKVPHLSIPDQLFIGAIANIPRPSRPWGAITWLSDVFDISRPTVYALGKRTAAGLERTSDGQSSTSESKLVTTEMKTMEETIVVTWNRVTRTALSLAFPGKVALRPMQDCLQEAFDQSRGVGTLSQLLTEAGQRAGQELEQIDHRSLGPVIVLRDETYFQEWPILIILEPVSTTILLAVVSEDRKADTWGAALLVSQERGAFIKGLVEDMARAYPKSQKMAEMKDVAVEKDTWHVENWAKRVRKALERRALTAVKKEYDLEKQLLKEWDEILFRNKYIPAVEKAERLMDDHDAFELWLDHLCDALELVDLRSGEIRDRETNAWLLEETLQAMEQIDQPQVRKLLKSLRKYQSELLTYLDWADEMLTSYHQMLAVHIPDPCQQQTFMRIVARTWRLRQALINGQRYRKQQAAEAEIDLQLLLADDQVLLALSTYLMNILDASGHTSSLIECINGLLKSFLRNRRAFRNRDTAQLYLNLFTLWHNMRVYKRGKRQGKSPYQWAGIDPGTDDWLELLGYPADA
jgi:hypothetical protein